VDGRGGVPYQPVVVDPFAAVERRQVVPGA
jgi:hypothetical protein